MRKLIAALLRNIGAHMPPQFRVLHQQFLLRVIDLESLSIEADIPRFIGQFAGILIFIGGALTLGLLIGSGGGSDLAALQSMGIHMVRMMVSGTMLIAGLTAVTTWDNIFPDRRDVMVLGPLPVPSRTILAAKLSASGSLLGIGVLALNFGIGTVLPLLAGGLLGFPRVFVAYWSAIVGAAAFVFGAVLTVQGMLAALLPQRWFLRLSAMLQVAGFGVVLTVWLFLPSFGAEELRAAHQSGVLMHWPAFWFVGVFSQLSGLFPFDLRVEAVRGGLALLAVGVGATASLLYCYLRMMKKTVEAPDLVPGAGGLHFNLWRGGLRMAVAMFSFRSLTRSRQHRVVLAFFLAIVFAIGLTCLRREIFAPASESVPRDFLISTLMMMSLSVLGLRAVFALPISLNANWVLRLTQLRPTSKYIAATRSTLLVFSAVPILATTALLALNYRPWRQVAAHIAMLALFGALFVEMALIKFDKVPFTCSYLPGKANVQIIFWGAVFVWIILGVLAGTYEFKALHDAKTYATMAGVLTALIAAVGAYNRVRARSAVLDFEEMPEEVVTRLGLLFVPSPPKAETEPLAPAGK